jgi:hypothetical protein
MLTMQVDFDLRPDKFLHSRTGNELTMTFLDSMPNGLLFHPDIISKDKVDTASRKAPQLLLTPNTIILIQVGNLIKFHEK